MKKYRRFAKFTVLEKFLAKGWLRFGDCKYSENDRILAGNRLADIYFRCAFPNAQAMNPARIFVDVSKGGKESLEQILDAREEYFEIVASIHKDYWPIVRRVCIEDKEPVVDKSDGAFVRKSLKSFSLKVDLCRGIDELIEFYIKKDKNNIF